MKMRRFGVSSLPLILVTVTFTIIIFSSLTSKRKDTSPLTACGDITIVTAFMDLGDFQKGNLLVGPEKVYKPNVFLEWMRSFQLIKNPVVAYLERDEHILLFKRFRKQFPPEKTKVVKVDRNKTWAFSLLPQVSKILSDPGYPKHHPNTVVPEYSITMHLKYELVNHTVQENPFQTKYFAWLDIGYFRSISDSDEKFFLCLPPDFNRSSVAYNQVYHFKEYSSVSEIFKGNIVWVGGGLFIGSGPALTLWIKEYCSYVELFLQKGLVNTDQQVIYSAFQAVTDKKPSTHIQTYSGWIGRDKWMHLGYLCKGDHLSLTDYYLLFPMMILDFLGLV